MELRHLRYFLAVAEELSFSRAAERLHMAQPPLSQQIRDLERETGLQLFDRSRRKIILTSAGRDFLTDARHVIESASRLGRNAQLRSEGNLGRLTIGVNTAIVTPHFFASMLRDFQRKNPGVSCSLVDYNSARQIEALLSGEIDVGFLRTSSQVPEMIETHRINREAMRIAVPVDHPLARRSRISWRNLSKERFILIQRDIAGDFYEEFYLKCRRAEFEPKVQQYVSNVSTQLWLISAGLGVAPMPITPETASGVKFVALPTDAPVYEIALAWRADDRSPVLQRFVQFVRKAGRAV